jgi:rsbT co-antagonist protein RsbR
MSDLFAAIQQNRQSVLEEWLKAVKAGSRKRGLIDQDLENQASEVLSVIGNAPAGASLEDTNAPVWQSLNHLLASFSVSGASLGFSPSEVSLFVLSLKAPLFRLARQLHKSNADELFVEISNIDNFVDRLALHTADSYIEGRNQIIARQQQEMMELSTPVVTLWEGIVALPLIGTLDSNRTQVVMESLLQAIVQTNSRFAIIDITGVPTVDTLVAQHLLKTITAARLMGAECILSGIRPQIAQTIVHLGIDLADVVTKARLADALKLALERSGRTVVRTNKAGAQPGVKPVAPREN